MEAQPSRSPVLLFLTAKPGNETAAPPRPHPHHTSKSAYMTKKFLSVTLNEFTYAIQPVTDTKQFGGMMVEATEAKTAYLIPNAWQNIPSGWQSLTQ